MCCAKINERLRRYSDGNSAKNEVKTLDGITRGSYSYIDANSQLQTVNYVSDALGFRVAATNLPHAPVDTNVAPVDLNAPPQPVEDTVEVKQARAEHLAAVAQAQQESSDSDSDTVELEAPEPVEDTEEVKQAREEHLQAVEDAKSRSSEASPIVVAQHAHQLIQAPVAHHILHPIHLTHSPVTLVRAAPASFAYSVYAPGSHLVVA